MRGGHKRVKGDLIYIHILEDGDIRRKFVQSLERKVEDKVNIDRGKMAAGEQDALPGFLAGAESASHGLKHSIIKALHAQGQPADSGCLQDFDTFRGEFGRGGFQGNFFDREFTLQKVYKREKFIQQDSGSAAAEVKVCKGESS